MTGLRRPGPNELGAEVSDGWWRGQVGLFRASDQWGRARGRSRSSRSTPWTAEERRGERRLVGPGGSAHLADLVEGEAIDLERLGARGEWRPVAVGEDATAPLVASRSTRPAGAGAPCALGRSAR